MKPAKIQRAAERYMAVMQNQTPGRVPTSELGIISGSPAYTVQGLGKIQDALVFSGEWFVVQYGQVLLDQFVQTPDPYTSAFIVGDNLDNPIELICELPSEPPIERAFLLGGCRNYCHWLLDYLPRLFFDEDKSLPLLVNDNLSAFQTESLDLLGIDAARLVSLKYPGNTVEPVGGRMASRGVRTVQKHPHPTRRIFISRGR